MTLMSKRAVKFIAGDSCLALASAMGVPAGGAPVAISSHGLFSSSKGKVPQGCADLLSSAIGEEDSPFAGMVIPSNLSEELAQLLNGATPIDPIGLDDGEQFSVSSLLES